MSSHLREDNECQNCGFSVEVAYCSRCGQKNTETRQPFHHLFAHVVEDLVHYDGAFWKTIKYLLFRPAKLTREYLQGYRQRYVPPVKLYIFISFVTFFIPAILPEINAESPVTVTANPPRTGQISQVQPEAVENAETPKSAREIFGFSSVAELDRLQQINKGEDKLHPFEYKVMRRLLEAKENGATTEKAGAAFLNLLPKVLFLYMPVFAFWLWLLHSNKRWYFFDHGIFTLHYFAFLLFLITFNVVLNWLCQLINIIIFSYISGIIIFISFPYAFFYFFRSHSRMYGEKKWISRLKGFTLFFINMICISVTILAAFYYAYVTVH